MSGNLCLRCFLYYATIIAHSHRFLVCRSAQYSAIGEIFYKCNVFIDFTNTFFSADYKNKKPLNYGDLSPQTAYIKAFAAISSP